MSELETISYKPFHPGSFDALPHDERETLILKVIMKQSNGQLAIAAKCLGMDESTLQNKLKNYSLEIN